MFTLKGVFCFSDTPGHGCGWAETPCTDRGGDLIQDTPTPDTSKRISRWDETPMSGGTSRTMTPSTETLISMAATGINPGGMTPSLTPVGITLTDMTPGGFTPSGTTPVEQNAIPMATPTPGHHMSTPIGEGFLGTTTPSTEASISMTATGMNPGGMTPSLTPVGMTLTDMTPDGFTPSETTPVEQNAIAMATPTPGHHMSTPIGEGFLGTTTPSTEASISMTATGMNPGGMTPSLTPVGMTLSDMTPDGFTPSETTPVEQNAIAMVTPTSGHPMLMTPEQLQAYTLQQELHDRHRPLTDEDLETMGYKVNLPIHNFTGLSSLNNFNSGSRY